MLKKPIAKSSTVTTLSLALLVSLASTTQNFALAETLENADSAKAERSVGAAETPAISNINTSKQSQFQLGVNHLERFEPDKAIVCFSRAFLASKPESKMFRSKMMLLIGRAFQVDENDVAAMQAMEIAYELNPSDQTVVAYLAESLIRCNYFDRAEPHIKWLQNQKIKNTAALEVLSIASNRRSDSFHAKEYLELALKQPDSKSDTHLHLMYARLIGKLGLSKQAQAEFQLASDSATNEFLKHTAAATACRIAGKGAEQREHILAAGKVLPNEPTWHVEYGDLLASDKKPSAALDQYNLSMHGRFSSRAYTRTIAFLREQKRFADAMKVAEHFVNMKPRAPEPLLQMANLNFHQKNYPEAEFIYVNAIAMDRFADQAYMDLARCYLAQNKTDKARETYQRGLKNCPTSITLRRRLVVLEAKAGHDEEVRKLCGEIIALTAESLSDKNVLVRNENAWANARLGALYYRDGDYDKALAAAKAWNTLKFVPVLPPPLSLIHLRPGLIDEGKTAAEQEYAHHIMLGDMLREGGRLDDSIAEFRKAENLNSADPDIHSYLLNVLDEKGDFIGCAKEDLAISAHIVNSAPGQLKQLTQPQKKTAGN